MTKDDVPDLVAGERSASESRGLGPAMLAGRDRSYSSSSLLPPLLSLLMNPCRRPTLGGGVATCKQATPLRMSLLQGERESRLGQIMTGESPGVARACVAVALADLLGCLIGGKLPDGQT